MNLLSGAEIYSVRCPYIERIRIIEIVFKENR